LTDFIDCESASVTFDARVVDPRGGDARGEDAPSGASFPGTTSVPGSGDVLAGCSAPADWSAQEMNSAGSSTGRQVVR